MKKKNRSILLRILKIARLVFFWIVAVHLFFILFTSFYLMMFNFINPPATTLMIYRKVFYGYPIKPVRFVSIKKMRYYIPRMVVSIEDGKFYKHGGIDPEAIQYALKMNKLMKRNFYGGSTINQQLSRTLFLIPRKWVIRKYLEMIIALQMNLIIPKERILELYLNYVEWGKGIYGVENASYQYYKKSSKNLTLDQSARLVTILSSPVKYTPHDFRQRQILISRYQFLLNIYQ